MHLYLSVFFAPLLLLFVITGWAQTMDFDHATPLLSRLSQVHLHQTFSLPERKGDGPRFGPGGPRLGEGDPRLGPGGPRFGGARRPGPGEMNAPMKWLIAAMSVALIVSISLGLVLAFTMVRNRLPVWIALILGIATPVALLAIGQNHGAPPAGQRETGLPPANGR